MNISFCNLNFDTHLLNISNFLDHFLCVAIKHRHKRSWHIKGYCIAAACGGMALRWDEMAKWASFSTAVQLGHKDRGSHKGDGSQIISVEPVVL